MLLARALRGIPGLVTDGTWRLSGGSGARRQPLKALQMSSSKGSCIVPLVKRAGQAVARSPVSRCACASCGSPPTICALILFACSIAILAALACPMAPETAVAAPTEVSISRFAAQPHKPPPPHTAFF